MQNEDAVVEDDAIAEDDAAEQLVFSGTDPIYENSAYSVTDPGPMDEAKQISADNAELCKQAEPVGDFASFVGNRGSSAPRPDPVPDETLVFEFGDEDTSPEEDEAAQREWAKELDIADWATMSREDLVVAIEAAEAE